MSNAGYTAPAILGVVVVGYGTDMVVVPVVVVSSVVAGVMVVSGVGGSVDVVSVVVWVVLAVIVVVVVVLRAADDVVVVDVIGPSVPDGAFEWRDVCTTANTSRPTTTRPATPAATTAPGRSYHSAAAGSAGRSSSL
jgi:hypothetical protein